MEKTELTTLRQQLHAVAEQMPELRQGAMAAAVAIDRYLGNEAETRKDRRKNTRQRERLVLY